MPALTTLAVSHNVYLTRQERYDLFDGKDIEVIGVSLPVWYKKGVTSEPATEVFARYKIANRSGPIMVHYHNQGYEITVPQVTPMVGNERPSDEIWNSMTVEEQMKWGENNEPSPSLANLLDIKDGGSEWLAFRQYNKIKRNKKTLNLIHFVEIKPIEELLATLT